MSRKQLQKDGGSKARLAQRAQQLKTDIPAVFLALRHQETPWYAKALAALTVAYALSPIDLVPDLIPLLGYLDDILLLPALVALTIKCVPAAVLEACRAQAKTIWQDGKPVRWYYALPIVLVWVLVIFLIVRCVIAGKRPD